MLVGQNLMAHQTRKYVCALLIGALREKLKRNGRALAFPPKEHQCAKGEDEACRNKLHLVPSG